MRGIERSFVVSGIVLGIIGMLLGLHMGITEQFDLAPAHAHLNLVGWVSLLLFGLAYRSGIAKADGWATVHFWIALVAAVLFPIGIAISILQQNPTLAIIGALLVLLSMVLFLVNVLRARA
ncbi:MAG TPA: hypothetical protein VMC10_18055 [Stellaceae bacterium]|nr:hypothetical protein [Stellaceae bacterium]